MIPSKQFGATGHVSKRTIFGAVALETISQDEANKTLELLFKYDINHIDVAASYGDAELRVGHWMKNHRKDFFLATKTEKRTYQEAKEELHRSLDRLQTDHIDLWQMHALIDPREWETAMGSGGALDAFIEARKQGLTKFLSVTGHGLHLPYLHLRSLDRFPFDSVLLPYNFLMMQDSKYASGFNQLIYVCKEKNVAVQTIKAILRGPLGDKKSIYDMWYDPLVDEKAIEHAVHWVLGNPDVFLNTAGDIRLLPKILEAADRFTYRPDDKIMQNDIEKYGMKPLFEEEYSI